MRFLIYGLAALVAIALLFAAYVRFAPTDPRAWNEPITAIEGADLPGGAIRVLEADIEMYRRVRSVLGDLPRTQLITRAREIVGSQKDERRITYVTRSRLWGFPDYTTVQFSGGVLKLYGRLRFGVVDMGVNRERLQQVFRAAEGG